MVTLLSLSTHGARVEQDGSPLVALSARNQKEDTNTDRAPNPRTGFQYRLYVRHWIIPNSARFLRIKVRFFTWRNLYHHSIPSSCRSDAVAAYLRVAAVIYSFS